MSRKLVRVSISELFSVSFSISSFMWDTNEATVDLAWLAVWLRSLICVFNAFSSCSKLSESVSHGSVASMLICPLVER